MKKRLPIETVWLAVVMLTICAELQEDRLSLEHLNPKIFLRSIHYPHTKPSIITYLQNGGKLEVAQQMASRESARTTGIYARRNHTVALDEVGRITH